MFVLVPVGVSSVVFLFMSYDVSKQFLWAGCRIRPLFYVRLLRSGCDDGTFSFVSHKRDTISSQQQSWLFQIQDIANQKLPAICDDINRANDQADEFRAGFNSLFFFL